MSWSEDLRFGRRGIARALLLIAVSLVVAALSVDWARAPSIELAVGDVAPRTITAPYDFHYQDTQARLRDQEAAREAVRPVLVYDEQLEERLAERVDSAFDSARGRLAASAEQPPTEDDMAESVVVFRDALSRHLPSRVLAPLAAAGFPEEAARLTRELLMAGMSGYVVGDVDTLPEQPGEFTLVAADDPERLEIATLELSDLDIPYDARQRITLRLLDSRSEADWTEAVATVARALVQHTVELDQAETVARQERAASSVPVRTVTVRRGTTLFRKGDPITAQDHLQYIEMQKSHTGRGQAWAFLTHALLVAFVLASVFAFGTLSLERFSNRFRDVASAALLIVMLAITSAMVAWLAPTLAGLLGAGATPESLFWVVPVAGAAMLVRLLIGAQWAVPFNAAASLCATMVLGGGVVEFGFFMASSTVAAGAVHHTRERLAILRAGLFTGVVNATLAFVLFYLSRTAVDGVSAEVGLGPLFAMAGAFLGGLGSAFVVLGLTPLFESFGFVTDYRLMELANLNHPLMRQLMLRAPGSYHHSVVVGSLAEAGCEAIGANALLARVASYFHDIGKSLKPAYFIENQGEGGNRHDKLDPQTSAEVIVGHVVEGGRMAREHNLPRPVIDNIYMHHGTGLLSYFYNKARSQADDPDSVDIRRFRYPGPKPSTREAGVIMLADKIEAATRTIAQPNEDNIRAMIKKIVDSVMADGQFSDCPLTMAEISVVLDTFVKTLLGIYHHRIEYADTADISKKSDQGEVSRVIPLPVHHERDDDPNTDYESVEHLPR